MIIVQLPRNKFSHSNMTIITTRMCLQRKLDDVTLCVAMLYIQLDTCVYIKTCVYIFFKNNISLCVGGGVPFIVKVPG